MQNAERCFVLKDYENALDLSKEVLSAETGSQSQKESSCICLQTCPLHLDCRSSKNEATTAKWLVRLNPDISLADRAAVVALQSGYEISNDTGRTAFLEYYSQRPMPLDVAIVWIQFSYRKDKGSMIEVTAELLHYAHHYPSVLDSVEDLVFLLFIEMLPFSSSAAHVRDLLDRIGAPTWSSSGPSMYLRAGEVNCRAVSILVSRLDMFSFDASDRCREELKSLVACSKTADECKKDLTMCNGNLIESQVIPPKTTWTGLVDDLSLKDWHLVLSRRLLDLFRIRIVQPFVYDKDRWKNRGSAGISALLLYLAWKKRLKMLLFTKSAMSLVTSPFREVMEALMPQQR